MTAVVVHNKYGNIAQPVGVERLLMEDVQHPIM